MDKKIAVLGAGESGVGAAILGKKKGYEVFLSEKENIDKKLPPIFVKQWTQPIPTNTNFLSLKNVALKFENLFLFKIKIEDMIRRIATRNLKSKKSLYFNAIIKNKTKKGRQNKLYSFKKLTSLIFDLKNWSALIVIDTGIKMFMVFAKSYPNRRKEGVPKSSKPTPNTDWIAIRMTTMITSKNMSI